MLRLADVSGDQLGKIKIVGNSPSNYLSLVFSSRVGGEQLQAESDLPAPHGRRSS